MNERDFREAYEAMQHDVTASSDLKQRTLAAAKREAGNVAPAPHAATSASDKRPHRRAGSRGPRTGGVAVARRWGLPAAACLVAAAIVAGGVPVVMGAMDAGGGHETISMSDAQLASGFAVRAYAADGSAPLAPGEGGIVAFDRDLGYRFLGGDDYKVSGFFSGCLFHVEGKGIARVQANLSSGALYRVTFEDGPTDPDDPRMGELASWKPAARGTGEYYGGYDFVGSSMRDGESKLSLAKLMGSTIDVSADDDPGIADGTTSFGLWTNEGEAPEDIMGDPQSPVIDLFDGQTLTVTVTFEDGSASTQVIELHVANFETEMVNGTPRLTTRLASDDAEDGIAVKSLYGTVVKAGSGPFPFPLDDANDRADEVLPAGSTLERAEETHPVSSFSNGEAHDATLTNTTIRNASETATIQLRPPYEQSDDERELIVGSASVTRSAMPPSGKTPDAFAEVANGWLGNLAYFNKCTQERYGYAFNDDGTLTDQEFCYLEAALTITNPSEEIVELNSRDMGTFGLVDDEGRLLAIDTSYFTLDMTVGGDVEVDPDDPRNFTIAPGGTARLSLLHVLPNRLANDESLLLLAGFDKSGALAAFSIGEQL